MNLIVHRKGRERHGLFTKICFITKLAFIILLSACLQVSATGYGQTITLSENNVPLEQVLKSIERQTNYYFWYKPDEIKGTHAVSVKVENATIEETLKQCLNGLPFTFSLVGKMVVIKKVEDDPALKIILPEKADTLRGMVINEQNEPLPGASITIKEKNNGAITGSDGHFTLPGIADGDVLIISCIGYERQELKLSNQLYISIKLKQSVNKLDEMQVIAYGTTTKRLNTGNVSTINADEIERQPVMNLLAALSALVPRVNILPSSGISGSAVKVMIGGRTSINTNISNDPLFIIDGVPYANNNTSINSIYSALNGGLSPFNSLDATQIESIAILKDADATAIYGSRGANGVVLITTKKGIAGKTKISFGVYTGFQNVPRTMEMMNTKQYLAMRHEAFTNDKITPTPDNASDLLVWDTTRYTDWKKYLIGNKAGILDANISISGGSSQTQFYIGGGYHKETNVFPGNLYDSRSSFHLNLHHSSTNNKFQLSFTGSYGGEQNHVNAVDLTQFIYLLPPNSPKLIDSSGNLIWSYKGVPFENPLRYLKIKYLANTNNYLASLSTNYNIAKGLYLKSSFGYNSIFINENSGSPISSLNPESQSLEGNAKFANSNFKSIIIEPQINYSLQLGNGRLQALLGFTWQENTSGNMIISASGYTSDALLGSLSAAGDIISRSSSITQYKYAAIFGRLNYNKDEKYIINLTGRRDGSSRFGPGKRFANFGAIGMGWIFTNEDWMKSDLGLLSFGKLRASYGTSGNDRIGDYKYLDTWTATRNTYLGNSGLYPTRLFNPDYQWELNKKIEIGIELGLIGDKILLTADRYQNRSSNQLIQYALPSQTGGTSIVINFPATVQNSGFEIAANTINFNNQYFTWKTNLNIAFPRNRLINYPGLDESYYSYDNELNKPVDIKGGVIMNRINPKDGVYEFVNQEGALTYSPTSKDRVKGIFNPNPNFYGGIDNKFTFKQFEFDLLLQFKKQEGKNYLGNLITARWQPGMRYNMPLYVQNRWTPEHTYGQIQKYTTTTSSSAYQASNKVYFYGSNIMYSDASFLRFKNITLSYHLNKKLLSKFHLTSAKFYIHIQNAYTFTNFKGTDPEIQDILILPPLRTFVLGIQASL